MKKKFTLMILSVFMLISCVLGFVACNISFNGIVGYDGDSKAPYGEMPDEDVRIDGILNETMWQYCDYWVHTDPSIPGVTLHVTTHFSQKGLYIGAYSEDKNIYYNGKNLRYHNTNFDFRIALTEAETTASCVEVLVDSNSVFPGLTRVNAKSSVLGKGVNTGDSDGLAVEMFITWDDLGANLEKDGDSVILPEKVYLQTRYRYVAELRGTNSLAYNVRSTLAYSPDATTNQLTYFADFADFGANGYLTKDNENATVGDSANGYVKSAGWDISSEPNGSVRSTKGYYQAIFFKDLPANNFVMRTKLKYNKALHTQLGAKAGLITYKDMMNYRAVTIDLDASNVSDGRAIKSRLFTTTHYPSATYVLTPLTDGENISYTGNDETEITVIKNDANFYYIVNGEFVASEYMEYMNGVSTAGLYVMHGDVEFSDYSFQSFDEDLEGLNDEINKYCYKVSLGNNGLFEGGKLDPNKIAVKKGGNEELNVKVTVNSGYKLSDLTANGTSIYNQIVNVADSNGFSIRGIAEDTVFSAKFTKIADSEKVTISGVARGAGGKSMAGEVYVEAFDSSNKAVPLYNLSTLFASSRYEFKVLKGYKYKLTIVGSGYRLIEKTTEILTTDMKLETESPSNVVGGSISKKFTLPTGYSPSSVQLNVSSNANLWDLSRDNELVAEYNYTSGRASSPVYFSGEGGFNFVAEATITNVTRSDLFGDYEKDPAAGFVVNNGKVTTVFYLWQSGLRIMDADFNTRSDIRGLSGANTVNEIGTITNLKLIRYEGTFYVFINDKFVYKREDTHLATAVTNNGQATSINSPVAVGFGATASFPLSLRFENYSVKFDGDAQMEIENAIFANVVKGDGAQALTLEGIDQNGYATQGKSLSISASDLRGNAYVIKVADDNGKESSYIITEDNPRVALTVPMASNVVITAEKISQVGILNVTAKADGALRSDAEVYARWDDGKGEMKLVRSGTTYSAKLPYGEYEIEVYLNGFYSKKQTAILSSSNLTVNAELTKAVIGGSVQLDGMTYSSTENWIKSGDTLQVIDRKNYTYSAYFNDFTATNYVASIVTRISTNPDSPYYATDNVQGLTFVGGGNVMHVQLNGAGFRIMKDSPNSTNMIMTSGTDWNFFFDMSKAESGKDYVEVRMSIVREGNQLFVYVGLKDGAQKLYLILDAENGVTPIGDGHIVSVGAGRMEIMKELLRQTLGDGVLNSVGYTVHADPNNTKIHNSSMIYGATVSSSKEDIEAFLATTQN